MKRLIALFCILSVCKISTAQESKMFAVGEATLEKIVIEINDSYSTVASTKRELYFRWIKNLKSNFEFYRRYFQVDSSIKQSGVRLNIKPNPSTEQNELKLEIQIEYINVLKSADVVSDKKLYSINLNNFKTVANQMADDIYVKIFNKTSIFNSRIIFVSDVQSIGKKMIKEIYQVDFDGSNPKRLTFNRGYSLSPHISADGKYLAYTLIKEEGRVQKMKLMLKDLHQNQDRVLSEVPGINSGAFFSPDNTKVVLSQTRNGNADIVEIDIATGKKTFLTDHFAEDVDPSINGSGDKLAFLSSRSGAAMIYIQDYPKSTIPPKRISFVGQFNATPRFSPNGEYLVFSSWVENRFDIYRISSDGKELHRLTKDFGSNENPSFSPDSEFIVFSSLRVINSKNADQNLYIMDKNGEILGPITQNLGKCSAPRWAK